MLRADEIVAPNLRVIGASQDLRMARICVVDLHVGGIKHYLADGTDLRVLDLTQPAEVSELEGRETFAAGVVVHLGDTLSG